MDSLSVQEKPLSAIDAVAIIVGIVIGAGIFRTPSLVAANSGNEVCVLLVWLIGGAVSLIGALCYAELTSAYPHKGGDYHYLDRAFGKAPAFLFAWARMTVIQTGSIAMLAFLIGDYATAVHRVGGHNSSSLYAALTILTLTGFNIAGIRHGKRLQHVLTTAIVAGLLSVIFLCLADFPRAIALHNRPFPDGAALGKAMIFVLLTYGGWNEAAYLSSEIHDSNRNMIRVLICSIGVITAIYLLFNFALLQGLGLAAMSSSDVVAADLMREILGSDGAFYISLLIVVATLSTMNGIIITGARTNYALGLDFRMFGFLGKWRVRGSTPVNALLLQGTIALILVFLGTLTRSGFEMMVEFTAPVFWFFFLLVGVSVFVLRRKEPHAARPFRIPLYPFTPILFCVICLYMLQASLIYTGRGALAGVGVLLAGVPLFLIKKPRERVGGKEVQKTVWSPEP
ncbi:MAG: APC family permease [Syntrophales bacterium]